MGCNCRKNRVRSVRSSSIRSPRASSAPSTRAASLCTSIAKAGNSLLVRVGPTGSLHLAFPPSALPVPQLLSSMGCSGSFSAALLSASSKLVVCRMSPNASSVVRELSVGPAMTLGHLRDVLRSL